MDKLRIGYKLTDEEFKKVNDELSNQKHFCASCGNLMFDGTTIKQRKDGKWVHGGCNE